MEEISVIVNQTPGVVSWNFEEVKAFLEESLKTYQTTIYTDDTIKSAKSDVAALRKLSGAIEDRRKEIKDKCLEPYAIIEAQAKELVALIDKPIGAINEQVKDYENRRKEKVRAEILAYWQQRAGSLPEEVREKAKNAIYDPRWENATATKKSWRDGIDAGIDRITSELETIRSMQSEFEEDMLTVYKATLSLQSAIQKKNELDMQKRRILEMERQRKEREEEERRRREAAAAAQAAKQETQPARAAEERPEPIQKAPEPVQRPVLEHAPAQQTGNRITLEITGTPIQLKKIRDYIRFTGADYREV